MFDMISTGYDPTLGFSFNPIKAVKSVGKGVAKVGKGAVHLTTNAAKASVHAAVAPAVFVKDVATGKNVIKSAGKLVKATVLSPIQATILDPLNATVLAPVKHKIDTLTNRRAAKLASDKRGPGARPTAAEHAEARAWTRKTLLKKPPIGTMFAVLAGAEMDEPTVLLGDSLGAVPVALVAAIPPALVLLNTLLKQTGGKGGEAPAPGAASTSSNAPGADSAAQAIQQYQQLYQQAAAIPQAVEQADQPAQVSVDATQPTAELPSADVPADAPVQGYYFGAAPSTGKTIGIVAGLAALVGAGIWVARS